jgi:hypothetical protein
VSKFIKKVYDPVQYREKPWPCLYFMRQSVNTDEGAPFVLSI